LGTGLITAGIALFKTLDIPFDADKSEQTIRQADEKTTLSPRAPWILIWGGAGITGIFLIQLARILGYRVICAASPVNHAYVKNLGAQVVLDRWLERDHLLEMIRIATNDDVGHPFSTERRIIKAKSNFRYHIRSKSLSITWAKRRRQYVNRSWRAPLSGERPAASRYLPSLKLVASSRLRVTLPLKWNPAPIRFDRYNSLESASQPPFTVIPTFPLASWATLRDYSRLEQSCRRVPTRSVEGYWGSSPAWID
jgi:hypothetical protein